MNLYRHAHHQHDHDEDDPKGCDSKCGMTAFILAAGCDTYTPRARQLAVGLELNILRRCSVAPAQSEASVTLVLQEDVDETRIVPHVGALRWCV